MLLPVWARAAASRLRAIVTLDRRALALFRVGLGLVTLADLGHRAIDLGAHYTDLGVLPRGPLLSRFTDAAMICVHAMTGSPAGMAALFGVHALFALGLVVGFHTRLCTVACWALLCSLHVRNPMVLQGGDDLLRLLLFWAIFLPLGARHGVDAALAAASQTTDDAPAPAEDFGVCTFATAALLTQVLLLYISSAALKTGPEWWPQGSAVYYALHYDQLALPLAYVLRHYYQLTVFLTYATLVMETVGWLGFVTPFYLGPARTAAVFGYGAMHVGFALCMMLGMFPFIDFVSLAPLLPAWFFNRAGKRFGMPQAIERQMQTTLYYDATCRVCRIVCFLLREALGLGAIRIAAAQRTPEVAHTMQVEHTWVVVQAGVYHVRINGLLALCGASPWAKVLLPMLRNPVIVRLGDAAYRRLAARRALWGRWVPAARPLPADSSTLGTAACMAAWVLVVWWNLANIPLTQMHFPAALRPTMLTLRLDHNWGMFAPSPARLDGWLVVEGTLDNGRVVDVLHPRNRPVSYAKPERIARDYGNQRRGKYFMNIWMSQHADYRLYFGQYLCRFYNGIGTPRTPESLQKFTINVMQEVTQPAYKETTPEKVTTWQHYCFELPNKT